MDNINNYSYSCISNYNNNNSSCENSENENQEFNSFLPLREDSNSCSFLLNPIHSNFPMTIYFIRKKEKEKLSKIKKSLRLYEKENKKKLKLNMNLKEKRENKREKEIILNNIKRKINKINWNNSINNNIIKNNNKNNNNKLEGKFKINKLFLKVKKNLIKKIL